VFAVTNGYLDTIDAAKIRSWEQGFLDFMAAQHPAIGDEIRTRKLLPEELGARLRKAIEEFKALGNT